VLVLGAGDRDEHDKQQDVQDERDPLPHPHVRRGGRRRYLPALQVADVERGAADRGRRDQLDERPGKLGQHRAEEGQVLGDESL
jgi:hypothetical protein